MEQIKLFYSYSQLDEEYRLEIEKSLRMLQRHDGLESWSFRQIPPGKDWDKTIKNELETSDIILFLVSRDFLASDYCYDIEVTRAMELHDSKKSIVVPIILRACDWKHKDSPFKKLEGLPEKAKPIKEWEDKDIAYNDITQKLKLTIAEVKQKKLDSKIINIKLNPLSVVNKLSDYPKPKPYFTGRLEELEKFQEAINSNVTFITIDGPGGIGKTQFVGRCIENYIPLNKVIYYECNPSSQLDTLIIDSGYPEIIGESKKSDIEKFSVFKDKIESNELFLFLDNFQDTNNNLVFKEFLKFIQKHLKKGCVVIIDRDDIRSVELTPKPIHIEGFKDEKLKYAKALINHAYKEDVIINDIELEKLCDELKGYPLAIDFAINLLSVGVTSNDIINKIVKDADVKDISERLLNAIFSRHDADQNEKDFICQFSVLRGIVTDDVVNAIIQIPNDIPRKLQKKNLLSNTNGFYEIHPLVREFCYEQLTQKESVHGRAAEYYINQRKENELNPVLEEQVFYHLSRSKQYERIEKEIEEKGRKFILQGQIGLVKDLLDKLNKLEIEKPIFNILYGDIAQIQGNWDESKRYFEKASKQYDDKKVKAEGLIKFGEILYRQSEVKNALVVFEQAYNFAIDNSNIKEQGRALNDIGLVYSFFGEGSKANENLLRALDIGNSANDLQGVADTLNNLADLFQHSDKQKALKYSKDSFDIYEKIDDKAGMVTALIGQSNYYRDIEEYNQADETIDKANKINLNLYNKEGIASLLRVKGTILIRRGKLNDALQILEKSLKIDQEINNKLGIANSLAGLADVHFNNNNIVKSIELYKDALHLVEEIGNMQSMTIIKGNLALSYKVNNELEKSLKMQIESLEIKETIGNKYGTAITLGNIANIYIEDNMRNYPEATFSIFKALAIDISIESTQIKNDRIFINNLRDKLVGLPEFRLLANEAFNRLPEDLKQFIQLNELCKIPIRVEHKVGRNDPCPCGSGTKYKKCHGKEN